MQPDDLNVHLSGISTMWTEMLQAHQDQGDAATATRRQLLLRYYGSVYRYLLGTVRDPGAAEELCQEFAVRFLRGDFKGADPGRGRFRDFLKTALRHLAMDYWRKKEKELAPLPSDSSGPTAACAPAGDDLDQRFLDKWREELLARTWEALAEVQETTGQPYHMVLHCKTDRPEARSAELAELLRAQLGKSFSEDSVRQLLHRARRRFAELLVDEVARSLETSDPGAVTEELIELGLLRYCRSAVERRDRA